VPDVVTAEFTSDETVIMSGSCVPNKSYRRCSYVLYAFLTLSQTIPVTAKKYHTTLASFLSSSECPMYNPYQTAITTYHTPTPGRATHQVSHKNHSDQLS
jgi:hypothetical protein